MTISYGWILIYLSAIDTNLIFHISKIMNSDMINMGMLLSLLYVGFIYFI